MTTIAYFVSSHGFGHAARASAVMAALHQRLPELGFEIFTRTPRWFFEDALYGPFAHHELETDVGLVQTDPLNEDMGATIDALNHFLPFDPEKTAALAGVLSRMDCRLVLCDISPLGLAIARQAGIPSVLIENFTWDWIYDNYDNAPPALKHHAAYLETVFAFADHHIQAQPVCAVRPCDLSAAPVGRGSRISREAVRQRLEIPVDQSMVLISMGGVPMTYGFLHQLHRKNGVCFVVPGASAAKQRDGNVVKLGVHSEFYHPDLMNAADAVVGKAGYSTIAEAYHCGTPFLYVSREAFPESPFLADFISRNMPSHPVTEEAFQNTAWLDDLDGLLSTPRRMPATANGANQIADFLINILYDPRPDMAGE